MVATFLYSFRVVTYNILADIYADSDFSRDYLFPHCPAEILSIDYRKQLLLKELRGSCFVCWLIYTNYCMLYFSEYITDYRDTKVYSEFPIHIDFYGYTESTEVLLIVSQERYLACEKSFFVNFWKFTLRNLTWNMVYSMKCGVTINNWQVKQNVKK